MLNKFEISSVNGHAFSKQGRSASQYSLKSSQTLSRSKNKKKSTLEEAEIIKKSPKKQNIQPFSKPTQVSKIQNSTDNLFGMYHPQFDSIYKKVHAFKYHDQKLIREQKTPNEQKLSELLKTKPTIFSNTQINIDSSMMQQSKSQYVMDFKKQTGRKAVIFMDVNENRFNYFPWPQISTKVNRIQNVSFAGQPRNNKYLGANISGMFYSKNYVQIEKRQDAGILSFQKQLGRIIEAPTYNYEEFLSKMSSKTNQRAPYLRPPNNYTMNASEGRSFSVPQLSKDLIESPNSFTKIPYLKS